MATNGEPRRGSDQEPAAFIGSRRQAVSPSPRRPAGGIVGGKGAAAGS